MEIIKNAIGRYEIRKLVAQDDDLDWHPATTHRYLFINHKSGKIGWSTDRYDSHKFRFYFLAKRWYDKLSDGEDKVVYSKDTV